MSEPASPLEEERLRMMQVVRGIGQRAEAAMRTTKPRSWEQLAQIQIKCIEVLAGMMQGMEPPKAPPLEVEGAERLAGLSAEAMDRISNIVLAAGLAPPPGEKDVQETEGG